MKVDLDLANGVVHASCVHCHRPARFSFRHPGAAHPAATTDDVGVLGWITTTSCSECAATYSLTVDADGARLELGFAPTDPVWTAHRLTWSPAGALAFGKLLGPSYVLTPVGTELGFHARLDGWRPLAFSPDSTRLLLESTKEDAQLALYELASRRSLELPRVPLSGGGSDDWRVAWDETARFLVLLGPGASGEEVVVLDLEKGAVRAAELRAPSSASFALSPSADRVIAYWSSGWGSGQIRGFGLDVETATLEEDATATHGDSLHGCALFEDSGDVVIAAAGSHDEVLRLRRFRRETLAPAESKDHPGLGAARLHALGFHAPSGALMVATGALHRFDRSFEPIEAPALDLSGGRLFAFDASSARLAIAGPASGVAVPPDIVIADLVAGGFVSLRATLPIPSTPGA